MDIFKKTILFSWLALFWGALAFAQFATETETDDTFDPFSDYSETNQTIEEEADIHFFRNGRLMNVETQLGIRSFTSTLGQLYAPGMSYGLGLTYFFDMRFATLLSFTTSDHAFELQSNGATTTGNVSMTFMCFDVKYYFNTDTMVKPLAQLNPYFLIGMNQTFRSFALSASGESARDNTLGLDFGSGVEIPLLKKTAFIGFSAVYRLFNFTDENKNLVDPVTLSPIPVKPFGDAFDLMLNLGINF